MAAPPFNVLILCTHNSARSILAEAMLNHLAAQQRLAVRAYSAGSQGGDAVNPLALAALHDAGISTDGLCSKSWDVFAQPGAPGLSAVITVCDAAAAEPCPVFLGGRAGQAPARAHWSYPDPSRADGGQAGRRQAFELTRQALGYRMLQLLALPLPGLPANQLAEALHAIGRS